jgi:hypothetical protein
MGRPKGAPTSRKEFRLEDRQIELLEALRLTASLGTPSLVSLVRQAVDQFIAREMAKADVRERVDSHLNEARKVVKLREVGKER